MSKRSSMDKVPKDFYPTTDTGAIPSSFLQYIKGKTYAEPCWGEGDLEDLLLGEAVCKWRSDLRKTYAVSKVMDAVEVTPFDIQECDLIVTNPPFTRSVLLPMIHHFISLKPTWLLLPADYMHNKYFGPYMEKCTRVVSIGRICWFPNGDKKVKSTDNFCWYFWPKGATDGTVTEFIGRCS